VIDVALPHAEGYRWVSYLTLSPIRGYVAWVSPLQADPAAADETSMLVTFPQAKAFLYLGLAAMLLVVAVALIGFNLSRSTGGSPSVPAVVSSGDATPGSTAHARQLLRAKLGR
jgi:hypothetical protein